MQSTITYNATVAQDQSGNYTSIIDAIAAAPENSKSRYYIHVKPGVYKEYVQVKKTNIALIGDAAATTIITGNKSNAEGIQTYDTATMFVGGPGFIAVSLTIENSAPQPNSHQAVALNNIADRSAFYKCVFLGYQDTLYADHNRQFYKECDIYGSVDFIFGSAKAVFQDCNIYARRFPLENVITAQAKASDPNIKDSGFSFQNCKITVAPEAVLHKSEVKAYIGRPWRNYATVVFMESYLDDIVAPEGWMPFGNNAKMFYAEYNNRGPGANTSKRVKWPGYKVFTNATEAFYSFQVD